MFYSDRKSDELEEKVIHIGRVAKTVKGGRNYSFVALVIVGDRKGRVGKGLGKAGEIPEAIRKGVERAKRNMIEVALEGTTIPHDIIGRYGAAQVLLRKAPEGTGVISGGSARAVLELAGIQDIRAKSLGSNNPNNVVNAVLDGLSALRTPAQVARLRNRKPEDL